MTPIVLLTNTYPYSGEQFLCTEMELAEAPVALWTFMPPEPGAVPQFTRAGVEMHVYDPRALRPLDRIGAAAASVRELFARGEFRAALQKPGKVRNLVKAVKFGYISELRVREIARWVRRTWGPSPKVLFYAYWMYEGAFAAARLKEYYPRARFVTRCHGYDLYGVRHKHGYLPFRRFILEQADGVFPVSEDGRRYLSERFGGAYDGKIQVARLGTLRRWPLPEGPAGEGTVLVSCSNLIPVKRVERIAAALRKARRPLDWYHFGDGPTRRAVEEAVQRLPGHVRAHLMGYVPNEEVQRFYARGQAVAFVNVSESEGVPVSVMEAQSYGIPVIATDVGGTGELVRTGENGVLLKKDFTDEDLVAALEDVIAHRAAYGSNARRTWAEMSDGSVLYPAFWRRLQEV